MTLKQNLIKIIPLTIILCGLLTYSFMQAQWVGPTADAPGANTDTPINIGVDYQAKLGDLGAVRMRSGAYCNAAGTKCFNLEDIENLATSTINYVNYAKKYCGLAVPYPSSFSLHGVVLNNGSFYDFYDGNGSSAILEWSCKGPNTTVNFEIQESCGLSVINPGSVSLHAVRLMNGGTYDLYDSNRATAILEWKCANNSPAYISNIQRSCGLKVPNPGSVSLHAIVDKKGNAFDLYDNNRASALLNWSCS